MKLESRIEHAAALAWLDWAMKEHGQIMPAPVAAFFNHVAHMVDVYERIHYPIPGPDPVTVCPECDHAHEGPICPSPYENGGEGHACIKCACKVRM